MFCLLSEIPISSISENLNFNMYFSFYKFKMLNLNLYYYIYFKENLNINVYLFKSYLSLKFKI